VKAILGRLIVSLQARNVSLLCLSVISPVMLAAAPSSSVDDNEAAPINKYHIEYVLFKQTQPDMQILRYEQANLSFASSDARVTANGFTAEPLGEYQVTYSDSGTERTLGSTTERLQSKGYEVLSEFSWVQAIDNDSQTLPLNIRPMEGTKSRMDSTSSLSAGPGESSALAFLPETYEGVLTVKRSRYMHAEIQLNYYFQSAVAYASLLDYLATPQWAAAPFIELVIPDIVQPSNSLEDSQGVIRTKSFSFKSSRRIKNGEIHYFDHPYLGLIVTISRVQDESGL